MIVGRIATQVYRVDRYKFTATLPRIGLSDDMQLWHAMVGDQDVPGAFATVEDAMIAAIAFAADSERAA